MSRAGVPTAGEIYEALADERLFWNLPERIAKAINAGAWAVGWVCSEGRDLFRYSSRNWEDHLTGASAEGGIAAPSKASQFTLFEDASPASALLPHCCIAVEAFNELGAGTMIFHRDHEAFDAGAEALLGGIKPHLSRLLELKARMMLVKSEAEAARAMMDKVPHPALLVDESLRLQEANQAAVRLIEKGSPVQLRGGQVEIAPCEERDIGRLVAGVCRLEGGAETLALRAASGRSLTATIVPVRTGNGRKSAMIWIESAADQLPPPPSPEHLRSLFNLTASEAGVASSVAAGCSAAEIAEQRGVSIETVRTQLKSLKNKLGCHRQTELVAVVNNHGRLTAERLRQQADGRD